MKTSAQIAFSYAARSTVHFLPGQFWRGEGAGGWGRNLSEKCAQALRCMRIIHQARRVDINHYWALDLSLER